MKKTKAAKIDGTVFYNAAKKYGLSTSNASLNKIVKLVNSKGLTPLQAVELSKKGLDKAISNL